MTATHESAAPGPDQENQAAAPAQPQTVGNPDAQAQSQAEAVGVTQEALDAAQAQVAALQDQLLRAQAEMENVRRRAQEEVSKARKFGIESFAESLVPVRDSLEAALAQGEQTAEALLGGVDVTLKQLTSAFERNHLKAIAPEPGEKFDPHQHQAISSVPSEHPANTVVNCLQKGYLIADRVLRPALVMVSAGPAA